MTQLCTDALMHWQVIRRECQTLPNCCFLKALIWFLAQNLERHGGWLHNALNKSYLVLFDTKALLGLGDWEEGATGNLTMYWHERFHNEVPEELIVMMFPFLPALEATVKAMGAAANISVSALPVVLRSLAVVLVQDALELAEAMPKNTVHAMLLQNATFECVSLQSASDCICPSLALTMLQRLQAVIDMRLHSGRRKSVHGWLADSFACLRSRDR